MKIYASNGGDPVEIKEKFVWRGLKHERVMANGRVSMYVVVPDPAAVEGTSYQYLADEEMVCFDVVANHICKPLDDDPSVVYPSEHDFFSNPFAASFAGNDMFEDDLRLEAVIFFRQMTKSLGGKP